MFLVVDKSFQERTPDCKAPLRAIRPGHVDPAPDGRKKKPQGEI